MKKSPAPKDTPIGGDGLPKPKPMDKPSPRVPDAAKTRPVKQS